MNTLPDVWKLATILLCTLLFNSAIYGDEMPSPEQATLKITFKNVESDDGNLMVALYDKEEEFLGKNVFNQAVEKAKTGDVDVIFTDVPPGNYAISCYHDENDDGELNTNFFGIPKEGLGISNDAPANFGPPKFKDAAFTVEDEDVSLEINMRY